MFVDANYSLPEGMVYFTNLFCSGATLDDCSGSVTFYCPGGPLGLTCYSTGRLKYNVYTWAIKPYVPMARCCNI